MAELLGVSLRIKNVWNLFLTFLDVGHHVVLSGSICRKITGSTDSNHLGAALDLKKKKR